MATTWLKSLHIKKGKSIKFSIAAIIDYADNPEKTDNGRLISSYGCDSRTADEEFILAKQEYEYLTGRSEGKNSVIAYHTRQSFKPGEVTPEEANEIGHELAMRFTKGKHAFIVCTHIDKSHVHNHIIFNSTTLDCTHKFNNFLGSSFALRRVSDLVCLEHGLSVIKKPKLSSGRDYGDWLGNKQPSHKDILKQKIDEIIPYCDTFEAFLERLKEADFEIRKNRKHITVKASGWGKPMRFDTLKGEYTESAIRERLGMEKFITSGGDNSAKVQVNLLIDIQEKISEGKGKGYERWAKLFNIKQTAKTLLYLKEIGVDSYDELVKKASSASVDFAVLNKRVKEIDLRLKNISALQKQIGIYGKTRDIYAKYKASGWSRSFYDEHAADIILHRAAKKYFDEQNFKNLPKMAELKQEYAELAAEKKKLYSDYHEMKDKNHKLQIARSNVEQVLGIKPEPQKTDTQLKKSEYNSQEI